MRIDLVSLFPEFIAQCAAFGVTHRTCERGLLSLHGWNPRDYAEGNYRRVDERTFGGGPGMVMMIEPLLATFAALRRADAATPPHVIYMSPQGRAFTQQRARELSLLPRIAILCGRYEGVDERFLQHAVDEEISIGDYVLSGGELAAAVVVDAIARLQPGALGDAESASQDSFENGLLDCPHYTKPVHHALGDVPEVLLSGHHAEIEKWRRRQALERTARRRPDLLQTAQLTQKERDALDQLLADS